MTTTFNVGDLVVVAPEYASKAYMGVVYRVDKILPVNISVTPVSGGRGLKGKPYQFVPADSAAATDAASQPIPEPLFAGTVVAVSGPGWKGGAGYYVVLSEKADGKVKLAKLGGDHGKYWPSIPRSYLTRVTGEFEPAV